MQINNIKLYTWGTPNGRKVSILLEELKLNYSVVEINITNNEQNNDSFVEINPNKKIPVITFDYENTKNLILCESGAILLFLSSMSKKFYSEKIFEKIVIDQWLMFQMSSIGPIFGQSHHFYKFNNGKSEYSTARFLTETKRLYSVMDSHLSNHSYFANNKYSIADISIFPWVARYSWHCVDIEKFKNVNRWFKLVSARDAVKKGMEVPFLN